MTPARGWEYATQRAEGPNICSRNTTVKHNVTRMDMPTSPTRASLGWRMPKAIEANVKLQEWAPRVAGTVTIGPIDPTTAPDAQDDDDEN